MAENQTLEELFQRALEHLEKGQEDRALECLEHAVSAGKRAAGEGHPRAPALLLKLAEFYQTRGMAEEAVDVFESARREVLAKLPQGHPVRSSVLYSLFMLYRHQGSLELALESIRETIDCLKSNEHTDTGVKIESMIEMASVYDDLVRPAEAEIMFKGALRIAAEILGEHDPFTILCLLGLAGFYRTQRRFDEAEPLYEAALQTAERLHDREDLKANCLNNFSMYYMDIDRYDLAEGLLLQSTEIGERFYQADHPEHLAGLSNLANLYMQQRRFEEAERIYLRVLAALNNTTSGTSPYLPISQMRLAELCQSSGRTNEAAAYCKLSLSAALTIAGPEHPYVHMVANNLAEILQAQGKIGDPEDLIRQHCYLLEGPEGIDNKEAIDNVVLLRAENPWYLEALESVARTLCGSGQRTARKGLIKRTAKKALERGDAEGAWLLMKLLYLRKNGRLSGRELDYLVGAGAMVGLERATREIHSILKILENGTSPLGVHYALAKLNLFGSCWQECFRWSEKVHRSDRKFRTTEMLNDMAYSLVHIGNEPDRAEELARQAYQNVCSTVVGGKEGAAWVRDTLGLALMRNGGVVEALGLLLLSYKADPCVMHAFHLSEAFCRICNIEKSTILLQTVMQMEPSCFEERHIQKIVRQARLKPQIIWKK